MYKSGKRRRPRCRKWGRKKTQGVIGCLKIARMSLCRGCAVNRSKKYQKQRAPRAYDCGRSFPGAASLDDFSLSLGFQKCIIRLRRWPFFFVLSDALLGGFSSWLSLLRSEWGPPTSLERLARLERLEALAWLVRRVPAAEKDAARSVEIRARGKKEAAEKRFRVLVIVDALLVKDGTSSTDA